MYLLVLVWFPWPIGCLSYEPKKLKTRTYGKFKMAASAHIVHQRKKFRKQISFKSPMSYTWNELNRLPQNQVYVQQSQKN